MARDDGVTVVDGGTVTFNVLTNDSDPDGQSLSLSRYDRVDASEGTLTCQTNGSCTFSGTRGHTGGVRFTYDVSDGQAADLGAVLITVEPPPNGAPVAGDDRAVVQEGGRVVIDVLANDRDPEGGALTVTIVTGPTAGTVTVGGSGAITYTHNANSGALKDSITYRITDPEGASDTGQVTIDVNRAPSARADAVTRWNGDPATFAR